ncbi:polysaccharide deacetylase family protein [Paenibacillus sp. 1011MAR3C5]|uniref:polysaccharide deacetylase family protein n=1 Tax=Paenibacillus sp. 1011MAR3C5 TaxID=1675787 RepID=UPI000E6B88E9|nr:polysaccharide deacetylase family protein [Paenibacillus sp. 1011MAR3C5]RJE85521.1 polysaccharide deacetylase family protein [Paenibacillus sp. 1011MAR3C5]
MMKTEALQTIELLSLEVKHGRHELQLAIERDGQRHVTALEVDESTGQQLLLLGPSEGERARLSLYTSWDPYREVHYSSIIKSNRQRSETHYFTCSKLYTDLIEQLRLGDWPDLAGDDRTGEEPPAEQKASLASTNTYVTKITRMMAASFRLLVLTCVLYAAWFELEGSFLANQGDALKELQVPVAATVDTAQEQMASRLNDHFVQAQGEEGSGAVMAANLPVEPEQAAASEEAAEKPAVAEVIELIIGEPYYSLPKGYVALTFDDGPSIYTKDIVDQLIKHEVAATFLFVGRNVSNNAESVAYAHEQGMAVGNHSWDHSNLATQKNDKMASNIAGANEKLEPFIGQSVSLFRPPYGSMNDRLSDTVEDMGMKMLMWNRDPEDWRTNAAEDIMQYFEQTDPSGGIYVLHEKKATLEALPDIIELLKQQDLKFAIFQ